MQMAHISRIKYKGIPPILTYVGYFYAIICKFCLVKNLLKSVLLFTLKKLFLHSWSFVLICACGYTLRSGYSANEVRGFAILHSIVAFCYNLKPIKTVRLWAWPSSNKLRVFLVLKIDPIEVVTWPIIFRMNLH